MKIIDFKNCSPSSYSPQWKIMNSYFDWKTFELYDDATCDFYEGMKKLYRKHFKEDYQNISLFNLEKLFDINQDQYHSLRGTMSLRDFRDLPSKEEILESVDWLAVVKKYVPSLKPASYDAERYKGLCPFHNEKTASFNVDFDKKLWYCHGEARGGDMFSFLMELHDCSFLDAFKIASQLS